MTTALIFDNGLQSSGITLRVALVCKKKDRDASVYKTAKIRSVSIVKEKLVSSMVYNVSYEAEYDTFGINLCDIDTIKRLNLKNDLVNFVIDMGEAENLTFDISLLNILQLINAKIPEVTKSIEDFLIDINFTIDSDGNEYLKELTSYVLFLEDATKAQNAELESLNSDFSMTSIGTNHNGSSTSLTSFSNSNSNSNLNMNMNSKRNIKRYITPKLFASKSNNRNTKNSNSHLPSLKSANSSSLNLPTSSSSLNLSSSKPDLNHDDTDGFLILQIESATGLPPFRNSTHLGYDMDPFVVVSFSKQIFKTAVCRHALNPSWKNQLINIRVSKYSLNFQLKLSVYDFDFFTYNDDICSASIDISSLIDESEYNQDDSWSYKKLPLAFSHKSLSKKIVRLKDYTPELSIRFKYVPVYSLANLYHDFNPKKTKCPYCHKIDKRNNSSLQHLSICKLNLKPSQFLHKHYTTSNNASRRWYTKVLAHVAYGRLTVGGNNAHILVQDRETGLVLEEKISAFVKLGIRLLYKSVKSDNSSEKIKRMLRVLSLKQGLRYDSSNSKSKIQGFVKFHGLNSTLSECLYPDLSSYPNFNAFFSRRLKPGVRPLEGGVDNTIIVSVADSRLVVFTNVTNAKTLWIKGTGFSIAKLLGKSIRKEIENKYSIAIFRLAPQDYHRVHVPLNGKIIKITHIHGSYYTVNPMAVRSALDVFGENVRTVVTLQTEEYGNVEIVLVGAMMVGSILISVKLNEEVKKGQELGYFKFGGSTVVLIFKNDDKNTGLAKVEWDGDLVSNSNKRLETLVKVGMSVGHKAGETGYQRGIKHEVSETERREVIRRVTGMSEGYGVGMGENLKAKLGGMLDDVMSLKSSGKRSSASYNQDAEKTIDELVDNDWEINELTTLDGINDFDRKKMSSSSDPNADDVEIDIALPTSFNEDDLYDMLGSDESDVEI